MMDENEEFTACRARRGTPSENADLFGMDVGTHFKRGYIGGSSVL